MAYTLETQQGTALTLLHLARQYFGGDGVVAREFLRSGPVRAHNHQRELRQALQRGEHYFKNQYFPALVSSVLGEKIHAELMQQDAWKRLRSGNMKPLRWPRSRRGIVASMWMRYSIGKKA